MTEMRTSFDWLAFLVRLIVIVGLATWLLIGRLNNQDHTGVALVVAIGQPNPPGRSLRPYALLQLEIHVWDR